MRGYLKRIKNSAVGRFYAKYSADRADEGAVLIAWQALFSLFPLILGMLSVVGLVLRDPARSRAVVDAIQSQFPSEAGDLLSFMEETRSVGGILGVISLAGLLWTGSKLFGEISTVFNRFYDAPDRSFIWQNLMSFTMMAIYLVLIVVSLGASGVGHSVATFGEWVLGYPLGTFAAWIGFILGLLISLGSAFLMFLVMFRVVPNVPLGFKDVWKGALLSGVLFLIVNQIFPIYLKFFGGGFEAYKTFGLFLLLITWLFFLTRIIVLGAELNAFVTGYGSREAAMPGTPQGGAGRQQQEKRGQQLAQAGRSNGRANGRADEPAVGKTILWAALSAGVTGLMAAAAQRTAAGIWRSMIGGEPPRKSGEGPRKVKLG